MTQTLLNNRYRIIRAMGAGGFGDTFLAEDTHMPSRRQCVIKQLKPLTTNPHIYQLVQERFQREAAILEELGEGNPQIPKLYAYFAIEGQFYLVQEYIEGQTLSQAVQITGSLNESVVQDVLMSLLPVLDYVHSHRMVHRDIKPDNIILRQRDGKPVLIDFGAVKETMGTVVNSEGNSASSIVIGTPGFMPSEQAAGRPMYSSDLFSLGLTAIYLITGKRPQELEVNPATGEIIWQQYARGVSPSLVAVLDKSIQSHPRDRFPSASAMLAALQMGSVPLNPTVTVAPDMPTVNVANTPLPATETDLRTVQHHRQNVPKKGFPKHAIIGILLITVSVISAFIAFLVNRQPSSELSVFQPRTSPSPIPLASSKNEVSRPSPEEAIRDYYAAINQQDYQTAWQMQSPQLQNNKKFNARGYTDYLSSWQPIKRVELKEVRLINQSAEAATVDVRLNYIDQGEQIAPNYPNYWRYFLIWDDREKRWLLDDRQ